MKNLVALVVDDNDINRELLCGIIDSDFKIIEACDGRTCIEKIDKYTTTISIILLDLIMPDVSGFEVL